MGPFRALWEVNGVLLNGCVFRGFTSLWVISPILVYPYGCIFSVVQRCGYNHQVFPSLQTEPPEPPCDYLSGTPHNYVGVYYPHTHTIMVLSYCFYHAPQWVGFWNPSPHIRVKTFEVTPLGIPHPIPHQPVYPRPPFSPYGQGQQLCHTDQ